MRTRNKVSLVLIGLAVVVMVGLWWSGRIPEVRMRYVFPDGFTGQFNTRFSIPEGVPLKRINGQYIYEIPENGTLLIRDPAPYGTAIIDVEPVLRSGNRLKYEYKVEQLEPGEATMRGPSKHGNGDQSGAVM